MTAVAFVGLGAMGKPMAANLLSAGIDLTVFNRSRAAADELGRLGANVAGSVQAVADGRDVVITMLPDTPDVESVATPLLASLGDGALWIEMSTISPLAARALHARSAERGVQFLDAPVSGGVAAAQSGSLTVLVGGDAAVVERARPLLDILGAQVTHIGGPGAGQVAKAANQILVGGTIALVAEALLVVQSMGVDPEPVREALLGGFAQSRVLDVHGRRMIDRAFEPGFRVDLQRKDLGIALDVAGAGGLDLPATTVAHRLFGGLSEHGGGDLDHSALILELERDDR